MLAETLENLQDVVRVVKGLYNEKINSTCMAVADSYTIVVGMFLRSTVTSDSSLGISVEPCLSSETFLLFRIVDKQNEVNCLMKGAIGTIKTNSGKTKKADAKPITYLVANPLAASNGCKAVIKIIASSTNPSTVFKVLLVYGLKVKCIKAITTNAASCIYAVVKIFETFMFTIMSSTSRHIM